MSDEESETSSGSEVEPTSTSEGDDEDDDEEPGAPTTETTMSDGGDFPMSMGCFRDDKEDRVLMGRFDSDMMTTEVSGGAGFDGQSAFRRSLVHRAFARPFRIPQRAAKIPPQTDYRPTNCTSLRPKCLSSH